MRLFINNGLIVDPLNNLKSPGSIMIEDGKIKEISMSDCTPSFLTNSQSEDLTIDASGKWVVPGLIDLHVHLREPGFEYKEDINSGCNSAAKGGFTTVCCMPNTNPPIDCAGVIRLIDDKAILANGVQVLCVGAITERQEGKKLAEYEDMIQALSKSSELTGKGICGISEDGMSVMDAELMHAAMRQAKRLGLTVFSHAEPEAEMVERDIKLAQSTGCKLHFCHISEGRSVELIRAAKKRGIAVTAETAPHYFTLNSSDINGDTNKKMNPPLRMGEDVAAIKEGLKDGTIDAIATDHAPHHENEKGLPYKLAPNGVVGLETSFSVSFTNLVKTGILTPSELIAKMSANPAEILGIDRGSLIIGKSADLTIIDIDKNYAIQAGSLLSKGKNSPFLDKEVFGEVAYTIVNGRIIWGR